MSNPDSNQALIAAISRLGAQLDARACLDALAQGANPDAVTESGVTALYMFSAIGNRAMVQELIARKANVHARDSLGRTALHIAADQDHALICALLIEAGCDVNAKDNYDDTPLSFMRFNRSDRTMATLLAYGAAAPKDHRLGGLTQRQAAVVAELPDLLFEQLLRNDSSAEQDKPDALMAFAMEKGLPHMCAMIQAHQAKQAIYSIAQSTSIKQIGPHG